MLKFALKISLLAAMFGVSYAGSMADIGMDPNQLLIEGGFSYRHSIFKNSNTSPNSYSAAFPTGFAYNPNDYYPANFYGGYFGLSFYTHHWLLNSRYTIFGSQTKFMPAADVTISHSPASLILSADRLWGDVNHLSYGIGAGVALETLNNGSFIVGPASDAPIDSSTTFTRTRFDPLVEGFVMKRVTDRLNVKANLAYIILVNSPDGVVGDLFATLGVNYALPL